MVYTPRHAQTVLGDTVYGRRVIDLEDDEVVAFIDLALDRMMSKAVGLGPRVSDRPSLDCSNSVFSLVVHCVGVAEWWLDHVVIGRPSVRDRDAEFDAFGTVADLESLVGRFRSELPDLIEQVARTPQPRSAYMESATAPLRAWPWTTASIVLHVIEELFQHAGHVDVTADLLATET
jgi:hypothetical protein